MPVTKLSGWGNVPDDTHPIWTLLRRPTFTPSEQKVLEILYSKRSSPANPVSKERLMDGLYADHPDPPFYDVIRTYIHTIRRKLPAGWKIRTRGWSGYELEVDRR